MSYLQTKIFLKKSFLQLQRNLLTFVEQIEIHYIMDRTTIEDAVFPNCPIRNILAKLCDKWSLLVIYTLNKADKATIRFKELQREIPDISQKMLTVTLRTLEDDGYVIRTVYPSSSKSRICTDISDTFSTSAYQCADRMGIGK